MSKINGNTVKSSPSTQRRTWQATLEFTPAQWRAMEAAGMDTCDSQLLVQLVVQRACSELNGIVRWVHNETRHPDRHAFRRLDKAVVDREVQLRRAARDTGLIPGPLAGVKVL